MRPLPKAKHVPSPTDDVTAFINRLNEDARQSCGFSPLGADVESAREQLKQDGIERFDYQPPAVRKFRDGGGR